MKRFLVLVAILFPLAAAGCSQPQVVAEAVLADEESGERLALSDLPIRLLPYDRDAIFDSLEQAYPDPEPPIPAAVLEQQQQVQEAQAAWRTAEARWQVVRDSMRDISTQLDAMSGQRNTPQYAQQFSRFETLDSEVGRLDQQVQETFAEFSRLQQESIASADSVRFQQNLWAEQAFADFSQIVAEKLRTEGREELADTTNAAGVARFRVPQGRWWVYARYTLPYEELYWNMPIDVTDDSTHVNLDRATSEVRPVL